MFRDRIARMLIIGGVIFFMIACILPTKDRFQMTSGGQQRIITRQDNPAIYWGTEVGVLIVAVSLITFGVYRGRKQKP